jgi:pectinesterase
MDRARRSVILGTLAATLAPRAAWSSDRAFDATVGRNGLVSLGEAIDRAPREATKPYRILLREGVWREKLTIDKPFIHLIGESRERSIITFDASSGQVAPDGERWGTRRSATLSIVATDFTASNLSIVNSFDYDRAVANPPPSAALGYQAVALALSAGADRSSFDNVFIEGHQDTLMTDAGRASFRDCRVRGHIDFIFGAGTAWFEDCEIVARMRGKTADEGRVGYLTAPSTLRATAYGLVFERCRLLKERDVPNGSYALGRPWRPTTQFADGRYGNPDAIGQAVFLHCWMDDHIDAAGWDRMGYNTKEGSRAFVEPADARFREYRNRGPGAKKHPSRVTLTRAEAREFARERVLGGWRPVRIG